MKLNAWPTTGGKLVAPAKDFGLWPKLFLPFEFIFALSDPESMHV